MTKRIAAVSVLMAAVLAGVGGCATGRRAAETGGDARFQREAVAYLASDHLEGRGPGTKGLERAGDWVANEFRKAGLRPAGDLAGSTYFQTFDFTMGLRIERAGTRLALGGEPLKLDSDFRPNTVTARNKAFEGDVVFAGYGISAPRREYDDFDGLDVKGKVVVVMRFEPRGADGNSRFTNSDEWSAEAGVARKILAAQSRGAAAVVLVNPPGSRDGDVISPFQGRGARGGVTIPVVQVSQAALGKALAARGLPTLEAMAKVIDESGKPASRELSGLRVSGEVRTVVEKAAVRNVVGVLPGEGALASEYVVVGAHYDHLGRGGPGSLAPFSNDIHHGADDNASGTTAMVTLARRLSASPPKGERRSVIFQAYTVEEQGLIGSQFWVDNPTVPGGTGAVAYMLNLDMVGRLEEDTLQYGGDGTSPLFGEVLTRAYEGTGLKGSSFGRGGFGPSDHASFARKRIPVIFLFTGLHSDYHRPGDTAGKINYEGMLKVTDIGEKITREMSVMPRSEYVSTYDGRQQDVGRQNQGPPTTGPVRERVGLGLMPDMSVRDGGGMRIDGVTPNGAAARAGLKAGDVLTELSGTKIDSVEDLQAVYERHQPGDVVKGKVLRDGKTVEFEVRFARRGGV